jgi:hypothetical protein
MQFRSIVFSTLASVSFACTAHVTDTSEPGASTSTEPVHAACAAGKPMPETLLFFGFDRAGMRPVSAEEWQNFVDTVITPLFSAGLTTEAASGQWQMMGAVVKEDSRVVTLIHDCSASALANIETIRKTYMTRFMQESVLRVDSTVCVEF